MKSGKKGKVTPFSTNVIDSKLRLNLREFINSKKAAGVMNINEKDNDEFLSELVLAVHLSLRRKKWSKTPEN